VGTSESIHWGNRPVTNVSNGIDPEKEAERTAAAERIVDLSSSLAEYRQRYAENPTYEDAQQITALEAALSIAQGKYNRLSGTNYEKDTERVAVDSQGESEPEDDSTPDTQQIPEVDEEVSEETTEEDEDGFYSSVNPSYVLDKRIQVMRTPDSSKHVFFLETYKSISSVLRGLQATEGSGTTEDREELQDNTRFNPDSLRVVINRGGILRSAEGEREDLEFTVPVYFPPNEGKYREDFMLDSCLWCSTSFNEEYTELSELFNTQLSPTAGETNFTFPVFYVSNRTEGSVRLAPLSNIKYFNINYDAENKFVDIAFWSNVRASWLTDRTREYYNAYPFTRDKDLRNVGRVAFTASGWYDTVLLEVSDGDVTREIKRNIFVFNTPTILQNPGLGGEFNVEQYEPVVDSIPWGFKFTEYTS